MAWTQSDLDAIEAAMASGELDVQYKDRRVRYRSIEELERARAIIQGALATPPATPVPKQVRMVEKTKGY